MLSTDVVMPVTSTDSVYAQTLNKVNAWQLNQHIPTISHKNVFNAVHNSYLSL